MIRTLFSAFTNPSAMTKPISSLKMSMITNDLTLSEKYTKRRKVNVYDREHMADYEAAVHPLHQRGPKAHV
jgi:hypothetical protein